MADAEKKEEEESSSYEESVEPEEERAAAAPKAAVPPPPPKAPAAHSCVPEPESSPRGGPAGAEKGKGKGIGKGKPGQGRNFCEHCWTEVGDHQSSTDQHQYWSIPCLRWHRFNQGMDWESALAAAHRMKNRRQERHNQALRSRAAGTTHSPAGHDKIKEKKTEKKKDKKDKKEPKQRKSPEPVEKPKSRKRDPSDHDEEDSPEGRVPKLIRQGKNTYLIQFS